jgi:TonB-linked SusC/RagA family outer membrane protein
MIKGLSKKHLLCWWAAIVIVCTAYAQDRYACSGKPAVHIKASVHQAPPLVPLLSVLRELNRTRGVYFLFTDQSVGETMVSDSVSETAGLEQVLTTLLKGTGLTFRKVNQLTFVILSAGIRGSPGRAGSLYMQDGKPVRAGDWVTGVVASDNGPLMGVTVAVKGQQSVAATDENGTFSIQTSPGSVLVFSSVGYEDAEAEARNTDMQVMLRPHKKELDEVVLTALGIKKSYQSIGYATSSLPGGDLTQSRVTNLGNAFSGKIAGVSVGGDATGPSGSSRVVIRGNSSVMGNNQPLYVLDGIPYDNSNYGLYATQYGGKDYGDGLSNISPDDIEDIQVLKGVAASALYGYRGGNGAILVTTKSGSSMQGLRVNMNNNFTLSRVNDQLDDQYIYGQGAEGVKPTSQAAAMASPYYSWGARLDGSPAVNFLDNNYPYFPAKNNFKYFYRTEVRNQTSVSVSGGNDKGHFRLGCSNLYLGAVIPNSSMKDQGLNLNAALNITKRLQMTLVADDVYEEVKNRASFSDAPGNLIASTFYLANSFDIRWLKPAVTPGGSELLPGTGAIYFNNPYFVAYRYQNNTDRNRLTGAATLKFTILDGLFVQGQVSRDGYVFDVTDVTPTGTGYQPGGNFTQYELNYHEMNEDFLLGWTRKLGKKIRLTANGGGNSQDNIVQDYGVGAVPTLVEGVKSQGPAGPFTVPYVYTAANILQKPYTRGYAHYRVNSFYGSLDLQYKSFFFLTATARNDWFSTLNIDHDHYLYPSVSSSIRFSDLWRLPGWITSGKWRISYAQASNGAAPYQNVLTYGQQGYTANGQALGYVAQSNIPNSNLEPVNIREWETGLNMEFLQGRLDVDFSLYDKKTTNDILPVTISATSGYTGDYLNTGLIRNEGLEALITAVPLHTKRFKWDVSLNYADNASKVLNLGPGTQQYVIGDSKARWGSEVNISNVVGLPYGQIMGFAYKRDDRGRVIYNSIGEPEQTGVVPLGSGTYKITGGLNNEFQYRNFSLSFLLDFKFGARIYSQTNLLLYFYGLQKTTLQGRENGFIGKGVDDAGKPNTIAVPAEQYFQDISAGGSDHIAEEFVYDAGFIKLRSFSLAYHMPSGMLKGTWIRKMSFSLVGRNLLILLKHVPNIDPESSLNASNGQGIELSGYPSTRSLGCNLNVEF